MIEKSIEDNAAERAAGMANGYRRIIGLVLDHVGERRHSCATPTPTNLVADMVSPLANSPSVRFE